MKRPRIFICHSSKDKVFVRDLVKRLSDDGVDAWLDEVEIHIGESIHQKVNDGLSKSDFFAVVLSQTSVQSKWVQEELSSASSMEKYRKCGIFVLPLLLEECEIPALLLDRRYANFKDDRDSAYQELLDAIRHHFAIQHPDVDVSAIQGGELSDTIVDDVVADPAHLQQLAPRHFEEFVASLLSRAGYDTQLSPITRDGGYDIVATRKPLLPGLGRDQLLVQCKAYTRPVGSPEVKLLSWRNPSKDMRPVMISRTRFTTQAHEEADKLGVDLIDAETLAAWIRLLLQIRKTRQEPAG